jgi:hypothetical protein
VPLRRARTFAICKGETRDSGREPGSKGLEVEATPAAEDVARAGGVDTSIGAGVGVGVGVGAVDKISLSGSAHGATITCCVVSPRG